MSRQGATARLCTKCEKPYIKPCDGAKESCGNLRFLLGLDTKPVPATPAKKPRKGR